MRRIVLGLILLAFLMLGFEPAEDRQRIQGRWKVAAVEFNGALLPDGADLKRFQEVSLTFDGEAVLHGQASAVKARFVMDSTKTPGALDIIEQTKAGDRKMLYLYGLEADSLKLCFTRNSGVNRPVELTSKNGQIVLIFQRDKPRLQPPPPLPPGK